MKKTFDRRDVLKGLLALPGAAALNGLPTTVLAEPMANPINLNVVLHGTIAIEFDTDQKRVFLRIPDVGDNSHEYKAGVAGFAINIAPGSSSINLTGINNTALPPALDNNNPPRNDLVVVRKKTTKFTLNPANKARNTFDLPFPDTISSARAEEFIESGRFFDDPNNLLQTQPFKVPLCIVMQYKIDEASIPSLPGDPSTVNKSHRNWHIYAEPGPGVATLMRLTTRLQAFAKNQNDAELSRLSTQMRDLIVKNKNFSHMLDSQHPVTAFDHITALYIGLDGLELSKEALIENNLDGARVPKFPDLGPGETSSLEELGPSVETPVSEGGSRVGTCAGLIIVN